MERSQLCITATDWICGGKARRRLVTGVSGQVYLFIIHGSGQRGTAFFRTRALEKRKTASKPGPISG